MNRTRAGSLIALFITSIGIFGISLFLAYYLQTTLGYSPNSNNTGGTLSLMDGTHSAKLALLGNYMASSFVMESDHHGGTIVLADVTQSWNQPLLANPQACVRAEPTAP